MCYRTKNNNHFKEAFLMQSFQSTATFPLTDPMRLIRRLCKHWAHKITTEYGDNEGFVDFKDHKIANLYAFDGTITIKITTPTKDDLERLQTVVANHVIRMIPQEEVCEIQWELSI